MTKENLKEKVQKAASKVSKEKKKSINEEFEELKLDYLRLRADFENYRKRTEEEKKEIRDRSISDFVLDIIPAIDNFEMSLKMSDNKEMFIKGVEMIHKNLNDTLKEHGFEEFVPELNSNFDAKFHEPILIESEGEAGKVLAIVKKGLKKGERILRPARVQVKKVD